MLTFPLTHKRANIPVHYHLFTYIHGLAQTFLITQAYIPMNTFILGKDTPIYFPTETLLYDGVKMVSLCLHNKLESISQKASQHQTQFSHIQLL